MNCGNQSERKNGQIEKIIKKSKEKKKQQISDIEKIYAR